MRGCDEDGLIAYDECKRSTARGHWGQVCPQQGKGGVGEPNGGRYGDERSDNLKGKKGKRIARVRGTSTINSTRAQEVTVRGGNRGQVRGHKYE